MIRRPREALYEVYSATNAVITMQVALESQFEAQSPPQIKYLELGLGFLPHCPAVRGRDNSALALNPPASVDKGWLKRRSIIVNPRKNAMTATSAPPAPTFADPMDPKVMECPYPFLEQLRREEPVHWVPSGNYFLVSRFADVQDVLRRHDVFSSDISHLFDGQGEVFIPAKVLNLSDPPQHSMTKPIALRAFSAARVNALEAHIAAIVDGLIDKFIDQGEVELLTQFAQPLPMTVIAEQLGVPVRDIDRLRHWSDEMLVFNNPSATAADRQRAKGAIAEANEYLMAVLRAKRAQPTDDVISTLATANTEPVPGMTPRPLTDAEALSMIQLLLVGGNETTTNAIGNGMLLLMQNPNVVEKLRAGKVAWEPTIEEFLRLESPVRGFWRLALRDTEVGGVPIAKGMLVFLSFASANRDPEHFPDAQCLDPSRDNVKTHVAFG